MININKFMSLLQQKKFNEAKSLINSQNFGINESNKSALKGILEFELKNYDKAIHYLKEASFTFPKNFSHISY